MITIALSGPNKFELLIDAVYQAMAQHNINMEAYEQLIEELNSSITNQYAIQMQGSEINIEHTQSPNLLCAAPSRTVGKPRNHSSNKVTIQRLPPYMVGSRGGHLHYQVSK